jgi:2-polyprenyl-6-methoxyphenol hydroxylase-like FAD-dependent oxidoreductase
MKQVDVCVRGGGAVGCSLALALARQGFEVALAQRAAPATAAGPDVRAYALGPASVALLQELRIWDSLPADARTPVEGMRIAGDQAGSAGTGQLEFSAWEQCVTALAWIVDAAALEDTLASALRFAPKVQRVASPVPAALQAVCEGRDSATRAELGIEFERHPYGQSALAARLVGDRPHQGLAWQWFRSPDVLALLPFDRPQARQSWGLVWSLPQEQAQHWLQADAAAFEAALNQATGRQPAPGVGAFRLAAGAGSGAALVRPGLGAGGRCRARGAPAGWPGPEPWAGRRGGAGGHLVRCAPHRALAAAG